MRHFASGEKEIGEFHRKWHQQIDSDTFVFLSLQSDISTSKPWQATKAVQTLWETPTFTNFLDVHSYLLLRKCYNWPGRKAFSPCTFFKEFATALTLNEERHLVSLLIRVWAFVVTGIVLLFTPAARVIEVKPRPTLTKILSSFAVFLSPLSLCLSLCLWVPWAVKRTSRLIKSKSKRKDKP